MERDHRRDRATRASVGNHKEEKIAMAWSCQPFNRTGKTDMQGSVEGGTGSGRPRMAWLDNIKS